MTVLAQFFMSISTVLSQGTWRNNYQAWQYIRLIVILYVSWHADSTGNALASSSCSTLHAGGGPHRQSLSEDTPRVKGTRWYLHTITNSWSYLKEHILPIDIIASGCDWERGMQNRTRVAMTRGVLLVQGTREMPGRELPAYSPGKDTAHIQIGKRVIYFVPSYLTAPPYPSTI